MATKPLAVGGSALNAQDQADVREQIGAAAYSGTPVSGQAAEWVSATAAQGVAVTGTGSYVKATSPTLVTPALGTPSAAVLTNATGLPTSGISVAATARLLGRATSGAGVAEEITLGTNLSLSGTTLNSASGSTTVENVLTSNSTTNALSAAMGKLLAASAGAGLSLTPFLAAASNEFGAALQAAHDTFGPDGGTIIIPGTSGYYTASTTAALTKPIVLVGCGVRASEVLTVTAGLVLITTTSRLNVKDMGFTAFGAAIGNCTFIKWLAAATLHNGSSVDGCWMEQASKCVHVERLTRMRFRGNNIHPTNGSGLYLENQTNSDEGENLVSDNVFSCLDNTSICVNATTVSDLIFTGNKFTGLALGHVLFNPGNQPVGNFLFSANSFEGHSAYAIKVVCGASGVCTKLVITGNQFSSDTSEAQIVLGLNAKNNTITGNTFNDTIANQGIGISILTGASNTVISGNAFHQIGTAVSALASYATGITMHGNRFASDVTKAFVGSNDDIAYGFTNLIITLVGNSTTDSNTVAAYVATVVGYGMIKVKATGLIGGVGWAVAQAEFLLLGATATQIGSTNYAGAAFDLVVDTASGKLQIGTKRNGATGTSVLMMVEVDATGHLAEFRRVA